MLLLKRPIPIKINHPIPLRKFIPRPFPPRPADRSIANERDAEIFDSIDHVHVAGDADFTLCCRRSVISEYDIFETIPDTRPDALAAL